MLCKRIIPCLDIQNGRIVKGTNFIDLKDAGDPVCVSENYSLQGADEIAVLDISATIESRTTTVDLIARIAKKVFVPLTVGGGIASISDIEKLLLNGADKVSINSAAIKNPSLIKEASMHFGAQCIVVAIDAKKNGNHYEVYTHGGRQPTGLKATDWAQKAQDLGAGEVLLTSIDRDGTCAGFNCELTQTISSLINIPLIASGGVGKVNDFVEGAKAGASGLLAASIFHFNHASILDVKLKMQAQNLPVRIEQKPLTL